MSDREYEPGELVVTEHVSLQLGSLALVRREWSYIPPGTFIMGSPDSDEEATKQEKPQHEVRLTRGFLMQRTPVTLAQWTAVMGTRSLRSDGSQQPVGDVSWFDAIAYCNALSRLDGLPEAYAISPIRRKVGWFKNARGYRLPTEAEWEYACRAGTTAPRYGNPADIAWYREQRMIDPEPDDLKSIWSSQWEWDDWEIKDVGMKSPNAWNLYDMLGNISEWTQDRYGPYSEEVQIDPQGPKASFGRVIRSGSRRDSASSVRAGYRQGNNPVYRSSTLGFRPVRSLP